MTQLQEWWRKRREPSQTPREPFRNKAAKLTASEVGKAAGKGVAIGFGIELMKLLALSAL